jgi:hypothetical protein
MVVSDRVLTDLQDGGLAGAFCAGGDGLGVFEGDDVERGYAVPVAPSGIDDAGRGDERHGVRLFRIWRGLRLNG